MAICLTINALWDIANLPARIRAQQLKLSVWMRFRAHWTRLNLFDDRLIGRTKSARKKQTGDLDHGAHISHCEYEKLNALKFFRFWALFIILARNTSIPCICRIPALQFYILIISRALSAISLNGKALKKKFLRYK